MSLFQSNLRQQIRHLPKILNFVKIIQYYLKLFTGVLRRERFNRVAAGDESAMLNIKKPGGDKGKGKGKSWNQGNQSQNRPKGGAKGALGSNMRSTSNPLLNTSIYFCIVLVLGCIDADRCK